MLYKTVIGQVLPVHWMPKSEQAFGLREIDLFAPDLLCVVDLHVYLLQCVISVFDHCILVNIVYKFAFQVKSGTAVHTELKSCFLFVFSRFHLNYMYVLHCCRLLQKLIE